MRRREFITLVGGVAAWPLAARAQRATNRPVIGFLGATTATAQSSWTNAFVQRIAELGWIDGRSVTIEYRWAEGRIDRAAEIAAEFVKLNVSVIVTAGVGPTLAASRATSIIPIVFAVNSDPLGTGLIKSLSHPGGNITGLSIQASDLAGKRIQLLRNVIPNATDFAILANVADPGATLEMRSVQELAPSLGLTLIPLEVRNVEDIEIRFASLKGRAKGLFVSADPFAFTNRQRIFSFAADAQLPTMTDLREYVLAGGLMSYGPNFPDFFRRAGEYVDKILRGAEPGDLPVEQPTTFDLVVSLPNARALGVEVPSTLLAVATEVIE
jgi:putative tryptophan/tyrosine transport system substrate-binding protein